MSSRILRLIETMSGAMPPVFTFNALEHLSGGALKGKTLRNLRSAGLIPNSVFVREGAKVLIIRDELLTWWGKRLSVETSKGRGE